jgi:hypothetical protein
MQLIAAGWTILFGSLGVAKLLKAKPLKLFQSRFFLISTLVALWILLSTFIIGRNMRATQCHRAVLP